MVGAAMVNGIVFPPCSIEEGVRINTDCYTRMLDDVYLHGTPWHRHVELVVAGRQRPITHQPAHQGILGGARHPAPHVASMLARLEPTRFSTALGDRQFTFQLVLRAMIVRTLSDLDPEATEQACTTGFIRRCLACVRQRRPFRAPPVMDQLTWTRFFLVSFDPS